jgi:hypothetical protein
MIRKRGWLTLLIFAAVIGSIGTPWRAKAQLSGPQNIIVLRVYFHDFPAKTRFTSSQVSTFFSNLNTLWGTETSYAKISLKTQITNLFEVPQDSSVYLDSEGGSFSTLAGFSALVNDAVAHAPSGLDWSNLHSLMILFADTKPGAFYRGLTYFAFSVNAPGGSITLPVSVVGEDPAEDPVSAWGRWGHEIGHELQVSSSSCTPCGPPHPSDYNSDFEIMDADYPGQSGMFEKESNTGYPGWMPTGKYFQVKPTEGGVASIYAEEHPPSTEPDYQAIKAFLSFGGTKVYYMISVRRRILGDNLNDTRTPNGIPDQGVLIERVVEGGDPNINDCPAPQTPCYRWVNVKGNGNSDTLWHLGDTYTSISDDIVINVAANPDPDHYTVRVSYPVGVAPASQPDVGLNSWLEPPGNTYETTDIWIDSPVNGYGTYRYGLWSDLMGGLVPKGNGDDPAVGLVNRLYARVRNYGTAPASNVTAYFDITNPPGLGINGSNGFINLGKVTSAQFPGLKLIPPGQHVDVYLNWTPNFALTPAQIKQGIFYFHTCVRVRLSHVAGETFFANQDGNGQQENIDYFQAAPNNGAPPGSPGPGNSAVIHLRNDSPAVSKQFYLSVLRETLPKSWLVILNGGNPIVTLAPGEVRDIPILVQQTATEAVGSQHGLRVFASSLATFTNPLHPHPHSETRSLGGVQVNVMVVERTSLTCAAAKGGIVTGKLSGVPAGQSGLKVLVQGVNTDNQLLPGVSALAEVAANGTFRAVLNGVGFVLPRGVCMFAGTQNAASAGSAIFDFP